MAEREQKKKNNEINKKKWYTWIDYIYKDLITNSLSHASANCGLQVKYTAYHLFYK